MSDSDSFIEEVSEEIRRDRLFRLFRRYGWVAIVVVVALVGGAAYNEWSKAQLRSAAQARGDAIMAALENDDSAARRAALADLAAEGDVRAVVALLTAAEAVTAEDIPAAVAALQGVEANADLPGLYRDLATLKRVILDADRTEPADRIADLQPLTAPGGAFRVLAEEQIALAEIEQGDTEAAIARLRALSNDTEATAGLRRRVSQLIVALGGEADPA